MKATNIFTNISINNPSLKLNSWHLVTSDASIKPSILLRFKNWSSFNGLIIISAIWDCELQYFSSMLPSLIRSLKKWKCTSLCLALPWKTRFFDNWIVELLSHRTNTWSSLKQKDSMILLIHMHWHAQEATAIYSVSIVDNVTTSFFFWWPWYCSTP